MNSCFSSECTVPIETSRSSCAYGRLWNSIRSTTVKTAVVAPIASASVARTVRVKAGLRRKRHAGRSGRPGGGFLGASRGAGGRWFRGWLRGRRNRGEPGGGRRWVTCRRRYTLGSTDRGGIAALRRGGALELHRAGLTIDGRRRFQRRLQKRVRGVMPAPHWEARELEIRRRRL